MYWQRRSLDSGEKPVGKRGLTPLFCSYRENRHMQTRTRHFVAHFPEAFRLGGFDGVHAAGAYALEQQEEKVGDESCTTYRCTAMFMHLPAVAEGRWVLQRVPVVSSEIGNAILHEPKRVADSKGEARPESEG
jgi:hypothetical protein